MSRWRDIRLVALYILGGLVAFVLAVAPYPRQLIFGPKIGGVPLCQWQDKIRRDANPEAFEASRKGNPACIWWIYGELPREPLDAWSSPDLGAVVLSLADDPDVDVRRFLPTLARVCDSADGDAALLQLLDDTDPEVRAASANAIARQRPLLKAAIPKLQAMLQDPDQKARDKARTALYCVRSGQKYRDPEFGP